MDVRRKKVYRDYSVSDQENPWKEFTRTSGRVLHRERLGEFHRGVAQAVTAKVRRWSTMSVYSKRARHKKKE